VAGCVLLNDLSVPHDSYYRPPVKFKCLDGFLGIGPRCVPLAEVGDIHALTLEVRINGELRQTVDFAGLVRDAAQLRLQQTVEGLSLAAITYYIVGLVGYAAKGAKAAGLAINPDLAMAISIPVVLLLGVWGLRKVRKALSRQ
jgi:hypothetical protein